MAIDEGAWKAAGFDPARHAQSFGATEAAPPPVDNNGMPMYNVKQVADHLMLSHPNAKNIPWEKDMVQHVQIRGTTNKSRRIWYSHEDLTDYVGRLRNSGKDDNERALNEAIWGQRHNSLVKTLEQGKTAQKAAIKNGSPVYDLKNQPHRHNQNSVILRGTRTYTPDSAELDTTQQPIPTMSNNLGNPVKHGLMVVANQPPVRGRPRKKPQE